jgi:transcriptional regulator with XRE-family HTH domain
VPRNSRLQSSQLAARFGPVLRSLRQRSGLSQEGLAEAADLHRTYLGLLERGQRIPSLVAIEALARALGMKPHELIEALEDFRGRALPWPPQPQTR